MVMGSLGCGETENWSKRLPLATLTEEPISLLAGLHPGSGLGARSGSGLGEPEQPLGGNPPRK